MHEPSNNHSNDINKDVPSPLTKLQEVTLDEPSILTSSIQDLAALEVVQEEPVQEEGVSIPETRTQNLPNVEPMDQDLLLGQTNTVDFVQQAVEVPLEPIHRVPSIQSSEVQQAAPPTPLAGETVPQSVHTQPLAPTTPTAPTQMHATLNAPIQPTTQSIDIRVPVASNLVVQQTSNTINQATIASQPVANNDPRYTNQSFVPLPHKPYNPKKPYIVIGVLACLLVATLLSIFALSNLRTPTELSLLDYVDVTFHGLDGSGHAEIDYEFPDYLYTDNATSEFLYDVYFEVSDEYELSNGDVVSVYVVYDQDLARKLNLSIYEDSFEMEVSGLLSKISSFADLSSMQQESMYQALEDTIVDINNDSETSTQLENMIIGQFEIDIKSGSYNDDGEYEIEEYKDYLVVPTGSSDSEAVAVMKVTYTASTKDGRGVTSISKYVLYRSTPLNKKILEDFSKFTFNLPTKSEVLTPSSKDVGAAITAYYKEKGLDVTLEEIDI